MSAPLGSREWYAELDTVLERELGLRQTDLTDYELRAVERMRVQGEKPERVAAQIGDERL